MTVTMGSASEVNEVCTAAERSSHATQCTSGLTACSSSSAVPGGWQGARR